MMRKNWDTELLPAVGGGREGGRGREEGQTMKCVSTTHTYTHTHTHTNTQVEAWFEEEGNRLGNRQIG